MRKYHTAAKQEHITAERTNRTTQSCRGNPQPNPTTVQNSDVANIDGSGGSHTLRPSYSSSSQSSSSSLQRTPEKQLASSSTTLVLITNTNPNRSKSIGARAPVPHAVRGAAPDEAERALPLILPAREYRKHDRPNPSNYRNNPHKIHRHAGTPSCNRQEEATSAEQQTDLCRVQRPTRGRRSKGDLKRV